ncbi:MAG: cutC [Mucilaginibacter sp.]|nr:cutC [Mucilaginibacter sp.]
MNHPVLLEVCANSVTSALAAQDGGAVRVELCENLYEGGTTPSYGEILIARKLLHINLYVLIRPRGGDFLYSDVEFEVMAADVRYCIEAGCDGIVIGILHPDGAIDKERCKKLVELAKPHGVGVTFHRAFDLSADLFQSLEDTIEIGCERILTSGGRSSAMEGAGVISRLIKKATGRIIIMPGCGISETNVADLVHYTGAKEIHASARKRSQSQMLFKNDRIVMGENYGDEYSVDVTDKNRVEKIIKLANS